MKSEGEMKVLIQDIQKVKKFFDDNVDKTSMWFMTNNPHLGGTKPIMFYLKGRGHKVSAFINAQIEENNE